MVWYAHGMAWYGMRMVWHGMYVICMVWYGIWHGIACMVGHEYAHTLREGGGVHCLF